LINLKIKIKIKKKYVVWFWVGTAHPATPDEPPLLESQTENENICLMFLGRPVSNARNKFGRSALVHEIMEDL
jgi:hypothetical protein